MYLWMYFIYYYWEYIFIRNIFYIYADSGDRQPIRMKQTYVGASPAVTFPMRWWLTTISSLLLLLYEPQEARSARPLQKHRRRLQWQNRNLQRTIGRCAIRALGATAHYMGIFVNHRNAWKQLEKEMTETALKIVSSLAALNWLGNTDWSECPTVQQYRFPFVNYRICFGIVLVLMLNLNNVLHSLKIFKQILYNVYIHIYIYIILLYSSCFYMFHLC